MEMPEDIPEYCQRGDNESWESAEMKDYAEKACALGVMGINMKEFKPNTEVTRAEFWTILSRILRWDKYNVDPDSDEVWYDKHLLALKEDDIMTKIDNPLNVIELREWVWLMLRRTQNIK